jgi:cullin-4
MAQMYKMFSEVDGLKILCAAFKAHIRVCLSPKPTDLPNNLGCLQTTVKAIVADPVLDDDMIQRLLEFNAFLDSAIPGAFIDLSGNSGSKHTKVSNGGTKDRSREEPSTLKANQDFLYARNDAFQGGFKARRNKPAELIAKYLDKAMRKGQKDANDADFEAMLNSALALYKFTEDKDVFRTFYHRALAKRLLLQRSASDDFEKAMLKKLKEGQ